MWWRDDLQVRQLVEQPGIDQPRQAGRCLVGPAEHEPDFVLGRLARWRSRENSAPRIGCTQTGEVVLRHALEDRPELRCRQRLAGDIGEDLDAAGAKFVDGAVDLGERGLDIVHRQRGDEGREMIGIPAADFGQRIIRQPREIRRPVGRCDQFERRVGERQHLLQSVELIEQRTPRIHVPQRLDARKGGHRGLARNEIGQPVEIGLGHEMIEDVEHDAWRDGGMKSGRVTGRRKANKVAQC